MSRVLKHNGRLARFGYRPNPEHRGELAVRTAHHLFALNMLTSAPDDNGDRLNYRMVMACAKAAHLSPWLTSADGTERLNSYDQNQSEACTGHGRSMQIALEDAATCVMAGAPGTAGAPVFKAMPAPEVQYAFGLEVDGTLGHDDGCSGSGIVEGSERYGTWYEMDVDLDSQGDNTETLSQGNWAGTTSADVARIAAWYQRIERFATKGVPANVAAMAAQHKSVSHANVTTVSQAWAAIGNAYAVLICSNVSFEGQRNAEGIIGATGHDWPHCMVVSSRRTSPTYGRLYLVHQSWEIDWTTGPYYADQPAGSFWITEKDLQSILVCQWNRRTVVRDCWTSTGHQGFTARADALPQWVKAA
jgi:hypothetical protein